MKKTEKLLVVLALVVGLGSLGFSLYKSQPLTTGGIEKSTYAYGAASAYSTTTLTNSVAGKLVSRATSSRNYVSICNTEGTNPLFIYKQATSTGVVVNKGYPLYASSTGRGDHCAVFGINGDSYTGEIWGISSATATVAVETNQN